MPRLQQWWIDVRGSLWFVPGQIVLGAVVAAVGLVQLDLLIAPEVLQGWPLLFGAGAVRYASIDQIAGDTLGDVLMGTAGSVLMALCLWLYHQMTNGRKLYGCRILRIYLLARGLSPSSSAIILHHDRGGYDAA